MTPVERVGQRDISFSTVGQKFDVEGRAEFTLAARESIIPCIVIYLPLRGKILGSVYCQGDVLYWRGHRHGYCIVSWKLASTCCFRLPIRRKLWYHS